MLGFKHDLRKYYGMAVASNCRSKYSLLVDLFFKSMSLKRYKLFIFITREGDDIGL